MISDALDYKDYVVKFIKFLGSTLKKKNGSRWLVIS